MSAGAARHRCPKCGTDMLLPTAADPLALEDLLGASQAVHEADKLRELLGRIYDQAGTPEGLRYGHPLAAELEQLVYSWRKA